MSRGFLRGMGVVATLVVAILAASEQFSAETTSATSYNPSASVSVSDTTAGANADITISFGIQAPDSNFQSVMSFTPPGFGVVACTAQTAGPACADQQIPDGTDIGDLDATATLGLINAGCTNTIQVHFDLMDATTNLNNTVVYHDTDGDGDGQQFEDDDNDGTPNAAEMYPEYLTRLLRTQPYPAGQPLQPVQRLYGQTNVAGDPVGINFLIFAPGTTINGSQMDPALGYPSFTLLNNTGDPEGVFEPTAITDFCTPLASEVTTFGMAGGIVNRTNPADGGYNFTVFTQSQYDADNDGWENNIDPCWNTANADWNPRSAAPANDTDADGLPNACDPSPAIANVDQDGDGFQNRGDNCPLVANENPRDGDIDGIGDACDPNPDSPTGHRHEVCLVDEVDIGSGGDPSVDPLDVPPCGDNPTTPTPTPVGTPTATPGTSATPTATPTGGGASPTTTVTAGPSPTPTPTPTATPVPTITPTADPDALMQGDLDCDGSTSARDGLVILAGVAGVEIDRNGCPESGAQVQGETIGDLDCDGDADIADALIAFMEASGMNAQPDGDCPRIGDPIA